MKAEQSEPQSRDLSKIMQLCQVMATIIEPPPKRSASQWADQKRNLPPESPEPGPFRSSRTPYIIPITEAIEDPHIRSIPVVMGSQMGKTEMIFNIIGKRFDDGPYTPALYIGPTQKQVKSISKDRIEKMMKTTPALWEKLEKGQRDGVTEKWIGGVRLGFGWAGSATELASHPAGFVLIDEYDRMDEDVSGEGDPYTLAKARTKNYSSGFVLTVSTPTIQDASPIQSLYDDGLMLAWAWPCPECEGVFVPKLHLLRWPKESTPTEARKKARLVCPHCGSEIENKHKYNMNSAGRYVQMIKDENGEYHMAEDQTMPDPPPSIVGFWVSGLASPWQSFGEIAEIILSAYRSKKRGRIQAAINTYAGELFKESGDRPKWEEVEKCKHDYEPGTLPEWVQLITLGADVQKDGIYYVIRGWGFNQQSALLLNGFIPGETEYDDVWDLASRQVSQQFGPPIDQMYISRAFVDSGYRPGDKSKRPDNQIYLFARKHHGLVYPTKGHDSQDRPIKAAKIDVTISGRVVKNGVQLWHIDTDFFKTWIYSRIRWDKDKPGAWYVHREIDLDYCKQIVSEELVIKSSGRRVWVQRKRDNHYLDAEVNAVAAAFAAQVHTLKPREPAPTPPAPAGPASGKSFKRKGLF